MTRFHLSCALVAALTLSACQSTLPVAPAAPGASQTATPSDAGQATTAPGDFVAPMLTPAEALAKIPGSPYVVVDARPAVPFDSEHIAGAYNSPPDAVGTSLEGLAKATPLLVYCTCEDEGLSLSTAKKLHDVHNFSNVQVLKGGLAGWKKAGLPTVGTAAANKVPTAGPKLPLSDKAAPTAAFVDTQGQTKTLQAFAGKPVLVTLYAYWCPHCLVVLPKIEAALKARGADAPTWVPIEASKGNADNVAGFIKTTGIQAPLFLDPNGLVPTDFNVQSYPTSYMLDASGTITFGAIGDISSRELAGFFGIGQ